MRLFVVRATRLPMRAEVHIESGSTTLDLTEELRRINDPANVVQRPQ